MNTTDVWPLAYEALRALGAQYGPAIQQALGEVGLESREFWLLWTAQMLEPEPISPARLQVRNPYSASQASEEGLAKATQQGFLAPVADNEYRLTEAGRLVVQRVTDESVYARLAALEPMPQASQERLASLLRRLVEASLTAPEPPGKAGIGVSRRTDPGNHAPAMVRIDQYLTDLNAYRDDAHLAAWQPYGFTGQAWEALTYLWRGEAKSLDELYEKLKFRGHSRAVYLEAMQDLVHRGLIEETAGAYQVTGPGQTFRQEAEDATNRYFYAPWTYLNESEVEELRHLLVRLREGLPETDA